MATRWYRLGTVSATLNSRTIAGVGTLWSSGNALKPEPGDLFTIDFASFYEIEAITSDTEILLYSNYRSPSITGTNYAIVRSSSVNLSTRIAGMVTDALNQKQRMLSEFDVWLTETVTNPVPIHDSLGNELMFKPMPIIIKEMQDLIDSGTGQIPIWADQAQKAAVQAQKWAVNPEDTEVEPNLFSALHYQRKSAVSATSASSSSSIASEQAALSQRWATNPIGVPVNVGGTEFSSLHHAARSRQEADRAEQAANGANNGTFPRGPWDASAGNFPSPTLLPAERADWYRIIAGGTMSDANPAQPDVTVVEGDTLYWNTVSDIWYAIPNVNLVRSVDGQSGDVVVDKYTQAEIDTRLTNVNDQLVRKQDSTTLISEVNIGSESFGRVVYAFDGVDDYITIPPAALVANDTVTFKYAAINAGGNQAFLSGGGTSFVSSVNSIWVLVGGTATIDGSPIVSGTTAVPADNNEHIIVFTATTGATLTNIGASTTAGNYTKQPIYDVELTTAAGNRRYVIDDGWSQNPVIADSLTSPRNVTNFDDSDDRIQIPTLTLSGEFSIEFIINTTDTGYSNVMSQSSTSSWIEVNPNTKIRCRVAGNSDRLDFPTMPSVNDGVDHKIIFSRDSSNQFNLNVDGVDHAEENNLIEAGDFVIDFIGAFGGSSDNYLGMIRDVRITGSENRYYPLDDGFSANPTIRETIGGQNGTALGFTADSWATVNEAKNGTAVGFDELNWVNSSSSTYCGVNLYTTAGAGAPSAFIRRNVDSTNEGSLEINNGSRVVDVIGQLRNNGAPIAASSSRFVDLGDVTSNLIIDHTQGSVFRARLTADTAILSIVGTPDPGLAVDILLILEQDATGGRLVTWSNTIDWSNGTPPRLSYLPNQKDIVSFLSYDSGSTYLGVLGSGQFGG